ncbi:MAG: hypothetical protein AAFX94_02435 [Myxococcota bacterium]
MKRCVITGTFFAMCACGGTDLPETSEFRITATSRAEHLEFFPIDEGSVHVLGDCNDCHGGFESFREFTCTETCHSGTGHPEADTAARHEAIPGYSWESTACFACHPEGD